MAKADYLLCEVCSNKAVYDGDDAIAERGQGAVDVAALCEVCSKTYDLVPTRRVPESPAPAGREAAEPGSLSEIAERVLRLTRNVAPDWPLKGYAIHDGINVQDIRALASVALCRPTDSDRNRAVMALGEMLLGRAKVYAAAPELKVWHDEPEVVAALAADAADAATPEGQ